jgi:hypothetical protein
MATPVIDPKEAKPSRPRRWFPVSLRIFLAILLLFGTISAGWVGVPAYRQHIARQTIKRLDRGFGVEVWRPRSLHDWLESHWEGSGELLEDVVAVGLFAPASDDDLKSIAGSTRVRDLTLDEVSDSGLKHFAGLTALETLRIDGDGLTDAGLAHLAGMTRMKSLDLPGVRLTEAGLDSLKSMKLLSTLRLDGTAVTDAGLRRLQGPTQLRHLHVGETQVSEADVADLQWELPELEVHR